MIGYRNSAHGITLANPADAQRFTVGERVWLERPPWWRRLLTFLRVIPRPKGTARVVLVDYERGVIEVE